MTASIRSPFAIDASAMMLAPFNLASTLKRSMLAMFQATWRNPAGHPMLKMVLIVTPDTAPKREKTRRHLSDLSPERPGSSMFPTASKWPWKRQYPHNRVSGKGGCRRRGESPGQHFHADDEHRHERFLHLRTGAENSIRNDQQVIGSEGEGENLQEIFSRFGNLPREAGCRYDAAIDTRQTAVKATEMKSPRRSDCFAASMARSSSPAPMALEITANEPMLIAFATMMTRKYI